ncbi:Bifunctional DNA primase/polymerase, N-terminal [Fulvimarina manganoxydans]|uniref:Bifunctional DNA primase/polymerase, N-terminal n=1 Tax=Fulvimarina manganoxydans TaxID=937218 RepID=A0A1W1Y8E2_9HYPH|nr:bifunctional DNA primase/polymerase [Fulvimarina manganoxydans]SMC32427.1 Bifunctional DNA primase/polymerase, N-terminal [Fulvimarina manganoxydans]
MYDEHDPRYLLGDLVDLDPMAEQPRAPRKPRYRSEREIAEEAATEEAARAYARDALSILKAAAGDDFPADIEIDPTPADQATPKESAASAPKPTLPVRRPVDLDDDDDDYDDDDFGAFGAVAALDGEEIVSTRFGEVIFGYLGPLIAKKGWAVIPQEQDGRRPAKVDGERLSWKKFQNEAPDVKTVRRWARQAIGMNAAVVLGRASACTFVVDIDVTDEMLSWSIQSAADEHLGRTEFVRVGNYPKAAIFYRVASPDLIPPNRSFRLLEDDGETLSEHQIEILGQGRVQTVNGRHHKTEDRFSWMRGASPSTHGPESAPLVTPEQIEAFLAAVQEIRRVKGPASMKLDPGVEIEWTAAAGDVAVPRMRSLSDEWTTDADGIVVDGREKYLFALAQRTCLANALLCRTPEGRQALVVAVTAEAVARIKTDHKRHSGWVRTEARRKTLAAAEFVTNNGIMPRPVVPGRMIERARSGPKGMTWAAEKREVVEPTKDERNEKRTEASEIVSSTILDFLLASAAWNALPEDERLDPMKLPAWLLKASASLGKTTNLLKTARRNEVLEAIVSLKNEHGRYPILMILPHHRVAAEVAQKAEDLGLDVIHHYGRAHELGGCAKDYRERAEVLQSAGISASGGCHTELVDIRGEKRDVWCRFHPENPDRPADVRSCAFIERLEKLDRFDLIVTVHAYGTSPVPEKMKNVRAVVVDESIAGNLLVERTFDRKVLLRDRATPRLTKAERKALCGDENAGENATLKITAGWRDQRRRLVKSVIEAWDARRDAAETIASSPERLADLEIALRICSRARQSPAKVTPQTSLREAIEMAAAETGDIAESLAEEHRMWKLLDERVREILQHRGGNEIEDLRSDNRVWPLADGKVQISWIRDFRFADKPVLFLDASGDEETMRVILGEDRTLICKDASVQADFRTTLVPSLRPLDENGRSARTCTFTKSRYVVKDKDSESVRKDKAALLADTRREIVGKAAAFGEGRILVVTPKAVRELLIDGWAAPANVDFLHFGALRGEDWAKRHAACLIFGVQYPNPVSIDGQVAALAHAARCDEDRIDPNGTGTIDGEPIPYLTESRRIAMRDGSDVYLPTMTYSGTIGRRLLGAIADEELTQAAARLRPIWRDDRPSLYIYGDRVPEGIVVDEISSLQEELEKGAAATLEVAIAKGGLIAEDTVGEKDFSAFVRRISGNGIVSAAFFRLAASDGTQAFVPGWMSDEEVEAIARARSSTIEHTPRRRPADKPPKPPKPRERSKMLDAFLGSRGSGGDPPDDFDDDEDFNIHPPELDEIPF